MSEKGVRKENPKLLMCQASKFLDYDGTEEMRVYKY